MYEVTTQTTTEEEFIRISSAISSVIDFEKCSKLVIDIQGIRGSAKSFIADIIMYCLQGKRGVSNIPRSNRMSLEKRSGQAVSEGVKCTFNTQDRKIAFEFVRNIEQSEDLTDERTAQVTFVSRSISKPLKEADISIVMKPMNPLEFPLSWNRSWKINFKEESVSLNRVKKLENQMQNKGRVLSL